MIQSGCVVTGLTSASMDVVLLYDVFHDIEDPECVLDEIRRVLKPEGVLSFSDHHMKRDEVIAALTGKGWFTLLAEGDRTLSFRAGADRPGSAAVP